MPLYHSIKRGSSTEIEDKLFFRVKDRCSPFIQELRKELIEEFNLEIDWIPDTSFLNEVSTSMKGRSSVFENCYYNTGDYNILQKPVIVINPKIKKECKYISDDLFLLEFMKKVEQYNQSLLKSKSEMEWHSVNCRKCRKIREKYLGKPLQKDSKKYEDKLKTATLPPDMVGLWGGMLQDLNRLKSADPWEAIRLRIAELEQDLLHRTKKS